jgi:hypothetical protein
LVKKISFSNVQEKSRSYSSQNGRLTAASVVEKLWLQFSLFLQCRKCQKNAYPEFFLFFEVEKFFSVPIFF